MIKDYFLLAYRSVQQRRLRSLLTMIGIFIGIAAVVALVSLSQGLENAVAEQFVKLGSDKLIVQAAGSTFGPPGTGVPVYLTKKDKDIVQKTNGVELAVGRLIRTITLEFHDEIKYSYAVSLPKDREERDLVIEVNDYQLAQGKFFTTASAFEVITSTHLVEDFFEKELHLRDTILIQDKPFTIVGLLKESGNPQKDHSFVLSEETLREILNLNDEYDIIAVKVQAGEDINTVAENIKKELRKSHALKEGKEDFTVESPQQLIATLTTILLIIEGILVGIAAISLFVGGIGIMNTMYTAVLERTKEIGILKAIGATQKNILSLFLIEAGFLGLLGGIIGVLLGLLISKTVEFITFQIYNAPLIQADISLPLIIGVLFFSFLVGAISGVLPARQAANLKPIEALRK